MNNHSQPSEQPASVALAQHGLPRVGLADHRLLRLGLRLGLLLLVDLGQLEGHVLDRLGGHLRRQQRRYVLRDVVVVHDPVDRAYPPLPRHRVYRDVARRGGRGLYERVHRLLRDLR